MEKSRGGKEQNPHLLWEQEEKKESSQIGIFKASINEVTFKRKVNYEK